MASPSRTYEFSSNVAPFDPLKYAKQLEEAGFTRTQAEVQAETFFGIVNENLVTKRDLKELENQLIQTIKELENKTALELENVRRDIENVRRDIKELESKTALEFESMRLSTKSHIELLRRDLKIWFGSMLVTVIVAFSTLLTVLPHVIGR
jgi:hypothetical protein